MSCLFAQPELRVGSTLGQCFPSQGSWFLLVLILVRILVSVCFPVSLNIFQFGIYHCHLGVCMLSSPLCHYQRSSPAPFTHFCDFACFPWYSDRIQTPVALHLPLQADPTCSHPDLPLVHHLPSRTLTFFYVPGANQADFHLLFFLWDAGFYIFIWLLTEVRQGCSEKWHFKDSFNVTSSEWPFLSS